MSNNTNHADKKLRMNEEKWTKKATTGTKKQESNDTLVMADPGLRRQVERESGRCQFLFLPKGKRCEMVP